MSDTSINVKPNESGVGGEAVAWMYEVSNGCDPEYWMTTCDKYKPEGPRYRNIRPLIFGDAPPPQPRAEGMVLVPIEPTPGMIQAFWGEVTHGDAELAHAINAYRDMLSAAPSEGSGDNNHGSASGGAADGRASGSTPQAQGYAKGFDSPRSLTTQPPAPAAEQPQGEDAAVRPFDWKRFAAMVADAMLAEGWGHAGFGESELREDVEAAVQNAFNGTGVEAVSPPAVAGNIAVYLSSNL